MIKDGIQQIFKQQLFLGYISKVNVYRSVVHIPSSSYLTKFNRYGESFQGGIINSYIIVEGEDKGFLGKIVTAEIPEKERLELSTNSLKNKEFHPLLQIEILSLFDYQKGVFEKSIIDFPNIGSKVYLARDKFVQKYLEEIELNPSELKTKDFSNIISPNTHEGIDISFQSLFSRHAAIVGTTGSGKSWTTASLINNLLDNKQDVILIDATGEYKEIAEEYSNPKDKVYLGKEHILSYRNLSPTFLFNLFTPSPGAQAPKLNEAIKSLKLLEVAHENPKLKIYINGDEIKTIEKTERDKNSFFEISNEEIGTILTENNKFDIRALGEQVQNECVNPGSGSINEGRFGGIDKNALGHCTTLVARINAIINDEHYNKIFDFKNDNNSSDLFNKLSEFIKREVSSEDKTGNLLYIDVSNVPYSHRMREIVVDLIGNKLLECSRQNKFIEKPMTVFIDEAHQFLNKTIQHENDLQPLDAFENISKEGRKYGLFLCLTTQLPRDIPTGILSQIGTFITHRLINQKDKEIISHVLPSSNEALINYLPSLGQGEAVISSNELKDTLYIKINEPRIKPVSQTPTYNLKR